MKRGISAVLIVCVLAFAGLWLGTSVAWACGYVSQPPINTHTTFSPVYEGEIGDHPTYAILTCGYSGGTYCLADYYIGAHSDDTSMSAVDAPGLTVSASCEHSWVWCGDPSDAPGCHYSVSFQGVGHAKAIGTAEKTEGAGDVISSGGGSSGGYASGGGEAAQASVTAGGGCQPSSYSWYVTGMVGAGTDGFYTIDSTSCGEEGSYGFYDVRGHWEISQTTPTRILSKGSTTITVHSNCWCSPGTAEVLAYGGSPGWGEATCEVHVDSAMSASVSIISTP